MTVDRLGENRVLLILCPQDMEEYSIDFEQLSLDDKSSRIGLVRLMRFACNETGIELVGKSVDIEALPFENECYILITVNEKVRRSYRIKEKSEYVCYALGSSGNFLDALEMIYRLNICCNKNSAYLYSDCYYLVFEYPSIPRKIKRLLSEFGKRNFGKVETARIIENGKPICRHNAIAQIGRHLV